MTLTNVSVPAVNYGIIAKEIYNFIRKTVKQACASGVVVGLSGGVDSSVVGTLCVNALGRERVIGILMPTDFTPKEDVEDARELAQQLGVRFKFVNIQSVCDRLFEDLDSSQDSPGQKMVRANVYARIRMIILYYYANLHNYLVAGTGDRSEALIGFFTKYGDGGVDFLPIIHLLKTQVRGLAEFLGIPYKISQKPSSPQLYPGHKATDEIPVDYHLLDLILVGLFDLKLPSKEVSHLTQVPIEIVEDVFMRFNNSKHKRVFPKSVKKL